MDLFTYGLQEELKKNAPLAQRFRPTSLEEFAGQQDLMAPGKPLYKAIKADILSSVIFYGPPGTGKTTLARIIARTTKSAFVQLNAVTSGVKDIRRVLEEAKERLGLHRQKNIVFIDEIHRFNKAQQDALLPAVEEGLIILIGATTENPYFTVNSPLVSRSRIYSFSHLDDNDIEGILKRALIEKDRGLGNYEVEVDSEVIEHIARLAGGDARTALNTLETAVLTATATSEKNKVTLESLSEIIQKKAVVYDRDGDQHYNVISAFIKSIRGSDPDAALYWLAVMLEAGEDLNFIARRIVISAAEDVGNADPQALSLAISTAKAVHMLGMPEARIPLAQAVTYLAVAAKSNAAYNGINQALKVVREGGSTEVPLHLKEAGYAGAKEFGHGKGYLYPHDYKGGVVPQDYLPEKLKGTVFYEPTENGVEKKIKLRLDKLREFKKGEE